MIFKGQTEQILGLEQPLKWQTRRLVKDGEFAENAHGRTVPDDVWGDEIDTVWNPNGPAKWQVGKTCAVQPGRTPPVESIRWERLRDISWEDCLAEGVIAVPVVSISVAPGMEGTMYECPICRKRAMLSAAPSPVSGIAVAGTGRRIGIVTCLC